MNIHIEGLSHTYSNASGYKTESLRDITLSIPKGASFGILGCSGSGKTTLLNLINGILTPDRGLISITDNDNRKLARQVLRSKTGMLFQDPVHQFFRETVLGELGVAVKGTGIDDSMIRHQAEIVLQMVGLDTGILEISPFQLSGGEQRKVAIASVLMQRPELLLLDEPTAGLDPSGQNAILESIRRVREDWGMTVVTASRSLADMVGFIEDVAVLDKGSIIVSGKKEKLLTELATLENAGIELPVVTRFMMRLKASIPELNHQILTVKEAGEELIRIRKLRQRKDRNAAEKNPEELPSRFNNNSSNGSTGKTVSDSCVYGNGLLC